MTHLILINGCGGSGKDTTGRLLLQSLQQGALLDIKALSQTQPWAFSEYQLGLRNAASLIKNYLDTGFPHVIVTGGVSSQDRLDFLVSLLPGRVRLLYVWLDVSKKVRDSRRVLRKRDEADKPQYLDSIDSIFTDPGILSVHDGEYMRINAEGMTPADVVEKIKTMLSKGV